MRNKKKLNPLFKIFILVSSLLFITAVIAIGMFYYVFGITEPEGLSLASWPERFTDNFSVWMENDNGKIRVKAIMDRGTPFLRIAMKILEVHGVI